MYRKQWGDNNWKNQKCPASGQSKGLKPLWRQKVMGRTYWNTVSGVRMEEQNIMFKHGLYTQASLGTEDILGETRHNK